MGTKDTRNGKLVVLEGLPKSSRSARLGKKLNPALKSWLDNVIIPALVREYMADMGKRNNLATTGDSEVLSKQDG